MRDEEISLEEAVLLFNERFTLAIPHFSYLEKILGDTSPTLWKRIPGWDELNDDEIYRHLHIPERHGQVLAVTSAAYLANRVLVWNASDLGSRLTRYRMDYDAPFFDGGDSILAWLQARSLVFFHHEGIYSEFSADDIRRSEQQR